MTATRFSPLTRSWLASFLTLAGDSLVLVGSTHCIVTAFLVCLFFSFFLKYIKLTSKPDQSKTTSTFPHPLYNKTSLILQHSYSQTSVELGPKFGQIIQQDKPNTTPQLLQGSSGARAKIWSNFTTRIAYLLQQC